MARREYAGAAEPLVLDATILAGTLTFTASGDVTGWPTGATNKFCVELDRGVAGKAEKMWARRSGHTFTLDGAGDRGADDTTAIGHIGAVVEHVLDSESMDEANAHVNDDSRDDHSQYLNTARHDITARHAVGTVIASGVPGTAAFGDSASEGVAVGASRTDHKHGMPSLGLVGDVTTQAIGDTPAAGSSVKPAHADHRHGMPAFGAPAASAPGDTASNGSGGDVARANHRHAREDTLGIFVQDFNNDGLLSCAANSDILLATIAVTLTARRILDISGDCSVHGSNLPVNLNYAGFMYITINGGQFPGAIPKRWDSQNLGGVLFPSHHFLASLAAGSYTIELHGGNDLGSVDAVWFASRNLVVTQIGG